MRKFAMFLKEHTLPIKEIVNIKGINISMSINVDNKIILMLRINNWQATKQNTYGKCFLIFFSILLLSCPIIEKFYIKVRKIFIKIDISSF